MTFDEAYELIRHIKPVYSPEARAKLRAANEQLAREADEARNPTGHAIARAFRATNERS